MPSSRLLRRAKQFVSDQKGELAPLPISEEQLNPDVQDDLSLQAYPLESTEDCYRVPYDFPRDADCSEFSFFEDGRQRTVQIGYIPACYGDVDVLIPVHYFMVAAVILERQNRDLKLWKAPLIREGILVKRSLVPDQSLLERFEDEGWLVVDTGDQPQQSSEGNYYDLRRRALQEAKKRRLEVEDRLIADWRKSSEAKDSYLVVDGTLMNFRDAENVRKCIGVSKSFGSRYFSVAEHNLIMNMSAFERSWTFRFHSLEDETDKLNQGPRERISWYLRLRRQNNTDPEFGLIRVEISHSYAENATEYAERFSRSLISERLPTSYPRPRWDKHLYPIVGCENYLSALMPSIETIYASMKG